MNSSTSKRGGTGKEAPLGNKKLKKCNLPTSCTYTASLCKCNSHLAIKTTFSNGRSGLQLINKRKGGEKD